MSWLSEHLGSNYGNRSLIRLHCLVHILKDDKYRGRGTTSGLPYFNSGRRNAVWMSIDQLIYGPGSSRSRDQQAPAKDVKTSIESTASTKSQCKKSLPDNLSRTWKHVTSIVYLARPSYAATIMWFPAPNGVRGI